MLKQYIKNLQSHTNSPAEIRTNTKVDELDGMNKTDKMDEIDKINGIDEVNE